MIDLGSAIWTLDKVATLSESVLLRMQPARNRFPVQLGLFLSFSPTQCHYPDTPKAPWHIELGGLDQARAGCAATHLGSWHCRG
jgi:hypothetical protein